MYSNLLFYFIHNIYIYIYIYIFIYTGPLIRIYYWMRW